MAGVAGAVAAGLWLVAAVVAAQSLPRLPKPYAFPRSPESPGVVVFDHETHLAGQPRPDCTACHPRLFRILEPGRPVDGGRVTHEWMAKKRQCGACHDGERATGLDQCDWCHDATHDATR